MPEYIQAIERYLLDNPKLSKPALVELLTKRFSNLSADEAWIIVSRYETACLSVSSGQILRCRRQTASGEASTILFRLLQR